MMVTQYYYRHSNSEAESGPSEPESGQTVPQPRPLGSSAYDVRLRIMSRSDPMIRRRVPGRGPAPGGRRRKSCLAGGGSRIRRLHLVNFAGRSSCHSECTASLSHDHSLPCRSVTVGPPWAVAHRRAAEHLICEFPHNMDRLNEFASFK
jgi:hypothetical protein